MSNPDSDSKNKPKSGGITGFNVGFGTGSGSAGGDVREVADGPPTLRVVVVSPLWPSEEATTQPPPNAKFVPLRKQDLDEAMGTLGVTLMLDVPDPLVPNAEPVRIEPRVASLKDLRPDVWLDKLPVLVALGKARQLLKGDNADTNRQEFRDQLAKVLPRSSWVDAICGVKQASSGAAAQPKAKAKQDNADAIDSLLAMVDVDVPAVEAPADISAASGASLLATIALGERRRKRPGTAIDRVNVAIADILRSLTQHPDMRRLEACWRGIRFFVSRTDYRKGVVLDLLTTTPASLHDSVLKVAELAADSAERGPIDLIVVDTEFGSTAHELETLGAWATVAETLCAPLVTNINVQALGYDNLAALSRSKRSVKDNEDPRAMFLRNLAARDEARWLFLTCNRVFAREPFTAKSARTGEVPLEEDTQAHVFFGSALAVASLVTASHERVGWPCSIVGPHNGRLDDMAVWESTEGKGGSIALEATVSEDIAREAARAGVALMVPAPNRDVALLTFAPVLYRGPIGPGGTSPAANLALGDQLFVSRVSNAILQIAVAIPASSPESAIKDVVVLALSEMFASAPGPKPKIHVRVSNGSVLEVTVQTNGFLNLGLPEIMLGARLG
jgi:type VI secretion system protein ImpC